MLLKNLQKKNFEMIKSGEKTHEGRVFKGDWRDVHVGDHIIFFCENEDVKVQIISVHHFLNFDLALKKFGRTMLPKISKKKRLKYYDNLYDHDIVEKHGVVIIEIKIV